MATRLTHAHVRLAAALLLSAVAACSEAATHETTTVVLATPAAAAETPAAPLPEVAPEHGALAGWTDVEARARGDAARGKALVERFECNRCHAGTNQPAPSFDRQCVHCHQLIVAEKLNVRGATKEKKDEWRDATHHYITTPSLASLGQTLRASWVASFLREPVKIRPHEEEWMPRLRISDADARDLAAYLTAGAAPLAETKLGGDADRGREIVTKKGCFMCHELTGATRSDVAAEVPTVAPEALWRGMTQAPDLRLARNRFRPDVVVRWIMDPASVRSDALMPKLGLSEQEARDAAAYILTTPLAPPPPSGPKITRLPLLERHVSYEEVASRVFRKSCTHCHADPSSNGDAGPGSVGGFGFAPRGIALLSYRGTQQGYIADDGARRSLFAQEPALREWGGSRLVAALVARHEETSGRPLGEVRGMPMGLPGLSLEEIQLVETWVAEGAPKD
jgi:cytochrome c2